MYWNTVNELLKNSLLELMQAKELSEFRLVSGTALSLYLGHRLSVDISKKAFYIFSIEGP